MHIRALAEFNELNNDLNVQGCDASKAELCYKAGSIKKEILAAIALIILILRLDSGDDNGVENVVDGASAAEVVYGFI